MGLHKLIVFMIENWESGAADQLAFKKESLSTLVIIKKGKNNVTEPFNMNFMSGSFCVCPGRTLVLIS